MEKNSKNIYSFSSNSDESNNKRNRSRSRSNDYKKNIDSNNININKNREYSNKKGDDILKKNGEITLFLDAYKRLTLRKYKGKLLVDIREFYYSEGEMKPGKKGISLSVDCWNKINDNIDFINESIKELK